jgi:hypothetical protein
MTEIEKLCRRDFLGKSLGIFAIAASSLTAYRVDCSVKDKLKIGKNNPQGQTFPLDGLIPRPKFALYDTVKGSISFDDYDHDVFHYQGMIVGFWWQPEAWRIPVGWVYQVFISNHEYSQAKVSMFEEFPENELIKENLVK